MNDNDIMMYIYGLLWCKCEVITLNYLIMPCHASTDNILILHVKCKMKGEIHNSTCERNIRTCYEELRDKWRQFCFFLWSIMKVCSNLFFTPVFMTWELVKKMLFWDNLSKVLHSFCHLWNVKKRHPKKVFFSVKPCLWREFFQTTFVFPCNIFFRLSCIILWILWLVCTDQTWMPFVLSKYRVVVYWASCGQNEYHKSKYLEKIVLKNVFLLPKLFFHSVSHMQNKAFFLSWKCLFLPQKSEKMAVSHFCNSWN